MRLICPPERFWELRASLKMLNHSGFLIRCPLGQAMFARYARMALPRVFVEISADLLPARISPSCAASCQWFNELVNNNHGMYQLGMFALGIILRGRQSAGYLILYTSGGDCG